MPFVVDEESQMMLCSYHTYKHDGNNWSEYAPQQMEVVLSDTKMTEDERIARLLRLFDKSKIFRILPHQ